MDALAAAFEPEKADVCAGCGRSGLQLLVCDDCSPGPVDQGSLVKKRFCALCMIGKKVRVFWPLDEQWYVGVVQQYDANTGEHLLAYPDGDTEWVKIGENADQQQQQLPPGGAVAGQAGAGGKGSADQQGQPPTAVVGTGRQGGATQGAAGDNAKAWNAQQQQQQQAEQQPGGSFRPPPPLSYAGIGTVPPPPHFGGLYPPSLPGSGPHPIPPSAYGYGPPGAGYVNSPPDVGHQSSSSKRKAGPKTWTKEEDQVLLSMVKQMRMPMKWSVVAQSLPDRTGKQCRERYVNHLNPRLKSSEWTPVEDATIFRLYDTTGSQWAKMAKMIPGRTDNGIKNRFHNLRRQLEREDEHRLRLSKPEDYPSEIYLDKMKKQLPKHLLGKSADLWDATAPGTLAVIAALSVLGGTGNRTHGMGIGRFGPFRSPKAGGEQCARCGLFAPSAQTGDEICSKTRWCKACTRVPPHLAGDLLRECLRLRKCQDAEKVKIINGMM
mmetsp:Transcript_36044/g.78916  ORF Transcript_36044/g.78916 Transcript_36044/m.78916 type:complete len:492 (+) Transcript_36044:221-1696(+)